MEEECNKDTAFIHAVHRVDPKRNINRHFNCTKIGEKKKMSTLRATYAERRNQTGAEM